MKACPACLVDNPIDSSFCRECGAKLVGRPERPPFGGTIVAAASPGAPPVGGAVPRAGFAGASRVYPSRAASSLPLGSPDYPAPAEARRDGARAEAPPIAPAPPMVVEGGSEVRRCRACNAENGAKARFCQECGQPLGGSGERPRSEPPRVAELPRAETPPDADLVVIAQDGSPGRRYPVESASVLIGSSESVAISLKRDPYVSPEHARLTFSAGGFAIEDTGSVNGVFVRIGGSVPLRSGDVLLVGLAVLRFEVIEESERNPQPAAKSGVRVFGTPPAPRYAKLSLLTVEDRPRDVYYLSRAETVIGREQGDIVFTDDPFMSRRHAALRRDPNTNHFTLRDLGSSNGTFIAIRGRHHLSAGDHVRIGQHLFRLDVRRTG